VLRQAKRRSAWTHPSNSCAAALACCQRLCPGHSVASDPVLQVWLDSAGCSSYICVCISHCIGTSRRMPACSWLSPHGRPRMYFECSWSTAAVLACPVYTICCRGNTLVHALLRSYLPLMAEHCACMRACARVLLLVRVRARGWVGGWGCVCTRSGGGCCRLVRHSLADWPSMQLTDPWSSCCPVVHCWPSLAAACTLVLLSGRSYWDSTCQTQYPCCIGFAHSSLAVSSV
jgi:hypothetical protein